MSNAILFGSRTPRISPILVSVPLECTCTTVSTAKLRFYRIDFHTNNGFSCRKRTKIPKEVLQGLAQPWSPAQHALHGPWFRIYIRALLLCARRLATPGQWWWCGTVMESIKKLVLLVSFPLCFMSFGTLGRSIGPPFFSWYVIFYWPGNLAPSGTYRSLGRLFNSVFNVFLGIPGILRYLFWAVPTPFQSHNACLSFAAHAKQRGSAVLNVLKFTLNHCVLFSQCPIFCRAYRRFLRAIACTFSPGLAHDHRVF